MEEQKQSLCPGVSEEGGLFLFFHGGEVNPDEPQRPLAKEAAPQTTSAGVV